METPKSNGKIGQSRGRAKERRKDRGQASQLHIDKINYVEEF